MKDCAKDFKLCSIFEDDSAQFFPVDFAGRIQNSSSKFLNHGIVTAVSSANQFMSHLIGVDDLTTFSPENVADR